MRCPACGATNPEEAKWCGQCYASFEQDPPEAPGPQAPAVAPTAETPPAPDGGPEAPPRPGFRRRGDDVEWQCPRCETFTSINELSCSVCGTPLAARYERDAPEPPRNWSAAIALSVVVPGAGHVAIGRYGSGAARVLLFAVWLIGGLLLSVSGGAQALPAAAPLYLGALVLWAGSLVDLFQLQRGDRELLAGRSLLWLVVGVIVLSMIGMFAAAGGAAGS